jgi:hypothetical protein
MVRIIHWGVTQARLCIAEIQKAVFVVRDPVYDHKVDIGGLYASVQQMTQRGCESIRSMPDPKGLLCIGGESTYICQSLEVSVALPALLSAF